MDILELVNTNELITCTLIIFSGRENPSFIIENPDSVAKLKGFFIDLDETKNPVENNYILGYNGFQLHIGAKVLSVDNGKINVLSGEGKDITYNDINRQLEKYLIELSKQYLPELVNIINSST